MGVPVAVTLLAATAAGSAAILAGAGGQVLIPPPSPSAPAVSPAPAPLPSMPAPSPSMPAPSAGESPFASGAAWAAVNCAEVRLRIAGGAPTDAGGPLVPVGATTVTRCETPLATPRPGLAGRTPAATRVAPPRVLTTGVDRFAAVLNALPPVPADQACLPITMPIQVSLVFTFPSRQPMPVIVDPTCSALIADDRARSYTALNPLLVFDTLFATQPTPR